MSKLQIQIILFQISLRYYFDMKKETIKLVLVVIKYLVTAALGYFGGNAFPLE